MLKYRSAYGRKYDKRRCGQRGVRGCCEVVRLCGCVAREDLDIGVKSGLGHENIEPQFQEPHRHRHQPHFQALRRLASPLMGNFTSPSLHLPFMFSPISSKMSFPSFL
jgi:hypothetical protein